MRYGSITGSFQATTLTGSLTKLTDGSSYLVAGNNVTISSASSGQITISAAGGGTSYFDSTTAGSVFTTGSLALIGAAAGVDSPADIGSDVFFYVSGSLDGLNKSVFGGDVRISGTLGQGDLVRTIGAGSHAEGSNTVASGSWSHAEGVQTYASGAYSHAEGYLTTAVTEYTHAEGFGTRAGIAALSGSWINPLGILELDSSYGDLTSYFPPGSAIVLTDFATYFTADSVSGSNYDGVITAVTASTTTNLPGAYITIAGFSLQPAYDYMSSIIRTSSHAEGYSTIALGEASHAEGNSTTALGDHSHAEGYLTLAGGSYSHAAGESTVALGFASYAGGSFTVASGSYQHVVGKYNARGNDFSLFVVGDGTSDAGVDRSDILRVNSGSSGGLGRVEVTGSFASTLGLSGSLTKLTDGTSYVIAGANVTVATGTNGALTVTSKPSGSDTQIQFNSSNSFGAASNFTYSSSENSLSAVNVSTTSVTASSVMAGASTVNLFNTTATTVNFAGAAGSTVNIGGSTSTGSISGDLVVGGRSNIGSAVETILTSNGGTGVVTFNTAAQSIFYANAPTGNITADFTNVPTTTSRVISTTVILSQSSPAYIVSAVRINGVAQTLNWVNGTQPTGTANKHDVFGFSLIRSGSTPTWVVLGQMSTYG